MTDYLNNERVKAARNYALAVPSVQSIDALCEVVAAVSGPARTLVDALTLIAQRTVHDTHIEGVDSCSVCIAARALAENASDSRELRQADERGNTPADRTSGEGTSRHAPASAPDSSGVAARPQGTALSFADMEWLEGEYQGERMAYAKARTAAGIEKADRRSKFLLRIINALRASPPSPGVSREQVEAAMLEVMAKGSTEGYYPDFVVAKLDALFSPAPAQEGTT